MTKKKFNFLEDPPTASSSEEEEIKSLSGEEEEEIEEDDEYSSEEEDDLMNPVNIPSGKKPNNPPAGDVRESSENKVDLASGSVNGVTVAKEGREEKSGKKRSNEKRSKDMHAKRARKVSENSEKKAGEETKKPLFQRLWSEEDEITLLQGMVDFKANTGNSPYNDMDRFYESIKKSIMSFEPSKNQMVDKIRSLKRRKYTEKLKEDIACFQKEHDKECFELGKYIWGADGMALESPLKSNVKKQKKKHESLKPLGKAIQGEKEVSEECENVEDNREVLVPALVNWFDNSFILDSVTRLGVEESAVKHRLSLLPVEIKKRMEEKWNMLEAKEFEVVKQKADFISEVTSLVAKAKRYLSDVSML